MNSIKKMAGAIGRSVYHALRTIILKLAGFRMLNPEQTIAFMAPYELKAIAGNKTTLPPVINCADNKTEVFPQKNINADTVYVWDHKDGAKKAALSKYGSVTIRKNVLSTDWNYNSFYMGLRQADKREKKTVVTAIALFSYVRRLLRFCFFSGCQAQPDQGCIAGKGICRYGGYLSPV
jgi:hypothetical protein